jgi:hypothetical protein
MTFRSLQAMVAHPTTSAKAARTIFVRSGDAIDMQALTIAASMK